MYWHFRRFSEKFPNSPCINYVQYGGGCAVCHCHGGGTSSVRMQMRSSDRAPHSSAVSWLCILFPLYLPLHFCFLASEWMNIFYQLKFSNVLPPDKLWKYNNNVHFKRRKIHLRPASCHYRPERSKDRFSGKVRAANESYSRKTNIITIITHFVSLLQLNRMQCKKR